MGDTYYRGSASDTPYPMRIWKSTKTLLKKIEEEEEEEELMDEHTKENYNRLKEMQEAEAKERTRLLRLWKTRFNNLKHYIEVTGEIYCFVKFRRFYINRYEGLYYWGLDTNYVIKKRMITLYHWDDDYILKKCPLIYKKMHKKIKDIINNSVEKGHFGTVKYCEHCGGKGHE